MVWKTNFDVSDYGDVLKLQKYSMTLNDVSDYGDVLKTQKFNTTMRSTFNSVVS